MNLNTLPFQYAIRGNRLVDLNGQMLAAAYEQRDRELEDYLGGVAPWQPFTFLNGWQNLGSGTATAAFRRVADIVYLRGIVSRPAGDLESSPITVLPVGYRPPALWIFGCRANGTVASARVDVATDGSVYPIGNGASGFSSYLSLGQVSFSVTP